MWFVIFFFSDVCRREENVPVCMCLCVCAWLCPGSLVCLACDLVVHRITCLSCVCVFVWTQLYTGPLVCLVCVCLCGHGSIQDHLPMCVKAKSQHLALLISSKMDLWLGLGLTVLSSRAAQELPGSACLTPRYWVDRYLLSYLMFTSVLGILVQLLKIFSWYLSIDKYRSRLQFSLFFLNCNTVMTLIKIKTLSLDKRTNLIELLKDKNSIKYF